MADIDNETADFIRTQGHYYDPAFAVPSTFDQQRGHDLQDALTRYRELFPDSNVASTLREDNWEWNSVIDHVKEVRPAYEARAAKKSTDRREAILSAFESIPGLIKVAEDNRALFPTHKDFQQSYQAFVQTVASTIMNLMSMLLPKAEIKKVFGKIFYQNDDASAVLAPLKAAMETLKGCTSKLKDELLVDTHGIVRETAKGVNMIRSTLVETKCGISTFSSKLDAIQENMDKQYQEMKRQVSLQASNAAEFYGIEAQNSLFIQLIEASELKLREQVRREFELLRAGHAEDNHWISEGELLTFLNASPTDLAKDLELSVSSSLVSLSPPQQASARGILSHPAFQRWIRADVPDILCIESNPTDVHLSPPSTRAGAHPLSAFSANFIATLSGHRDAVTLYFFSTLHTTDYNDPLSEPRALLASMITILALELRSRNLLRLGFIDKRQYVRDLQYGNIACLCHTFGALLRQFPRDTPVYCILDGISSYDRSDRPNWQDDVARILSTLVDLVGDGELRPMLKVLVTCPYRWELVERQVPENRRVYTMANLLDGGGGVAGSGMSRGFFDGMLDRAYEVPLGVSDGGRGQRAGDGYFRRGDGGEMAEDDYT
ncbi:hypothetical protein QBC32DRAFT_359593 [Pseudoneurospora amorphoporcata]|uniref:Fungal STAND N-terminal Goodbye domain-containing protein n=1 Tax=Pseudoneurospora amorphoporcata TaxID=241081 RepID=A0AAN6SJF5_9PEZI|nr:hypothetical protein QBC32DRAFT_359593 [Pseudoneurospora amorphoporcata]